MASNATLEQSRTACNRRSNSRKPLRLTSIARSDTLPQQRVQIHEISETGLLFESSIALEIGESLEIDLPEIGSVSAHVVWGSGAFVGCSFAKSISRSALSASLLRSDARPTADAILFPIVSDARQDSLGGSAPRVEELAALVEARMGVPPPQSLDAEQTDAHTAGSSASCATHQASAPMEVEQAEEEEPDTRRSFQTRLRVVLGSSVLLWGGMIWLVAAL